MNKLKVATTLKKAEGPKSSKDEAMVTVKQIVAATGHSEQSVYNWRHGVTRSKLKTVNKKMGGTHRVLCKRQVLIDWAKKEEIKLDLRALA